MESARKLKRRGVVKELRALARECGAEQCRDDSGEAKVKAMLESIVSLASAENVASARDAFRRYQKMFAPRGPARSVRRNDSRTSCNCEYLPLARH